MTTAGGAGRIVGDMSHADTFSAADAARMIRVPREDDDKYSRGVVGLRTGSARYRGAAVLGVEAAWRAGAGMVRFVGPDAVGDAVLARRPETVLGEGRVQAHVIGSGTDSAERSDDETRALRDVLESGVPVVVDAGALDLLVGRQTPLAIATPHARELARLGVTDADPSGADAERAEAARAAAATLGCTVLLKGYRTVVATPGGWIRTVSAGTAWLSTAGTGDVLAGALGAIVAAQSTAAIDDSELLGPLGATGAWVHGRAGSVAAAAESGAGHPIVALDVAERLSDVIGDLLRLG